MSGRTPDAFRIPVNPDWFPGPPNAAPRTLQATELEAPRPSELEAPQQETERDKIATLAAKSREERGVSADDTQETRYAKLSTKALTRAKGREMQRARPMENNPNKSKGRRIGRRVASLALSAAMIYAPFETALSYSSFKFSGEKISKGVVLDFTAPYNVDPDFDLIFQSLKSVAKGAL